MRARGRFFSNWLSTRKERTISGSTRLRDVRALRIQRGVMFARNLRYPRTTEPALDEKSLASLGIEFLPPGSKESRWLPVRLPWSQIEEESCQHQPNHGTPPHEVARIDALDVQTTKRKQRRYREDDETHNQAVKDS